MWWLLAVQALACDSDVWQDLNCNSVDVADEPAVDLTDPVCLAWTDADGIPFPNADWYFDYTSYGCAIPVSTLDLDEDGHSDGVVKLSATDFYPDLVLTFACDNCPTDPNRDQTDTDCDDVGDVCDNCPVIRNRTQSDVDGDGHGAECDNCRIVYNVDQADRDGDLVGDLCDLCPTAVDPDQLDGDGDEVGDACDNCPFDPNEEQTDADGDRIGDDCDLCVYDRVLEAADSDGDGWGNACDTCPAVANPEQADADEDGRGDDCDPCPSVYDPVDADWDGDGAGDRCDPRVPPELLPADEGAALRGGGCADGTAAASLLVLGWLTRRARPSQSRSRPSSGGSSAPG